MTLKKKDVLSPLSQRLWSSYAKEQGKNKFAFIVCIVYILKKTKSGVF